MNFQLMLNKLVRYELKRCKELYEELSGKFRELPKGSLLDRNGHIYRAFREEGIQYQKPIKSDENLLYNLRLRSHLRKSLPDLECRIKACSLFLANERFYDPVYIEEKLKPLYKGALTGELFLEEDISAEAWRTEKYIRNTYPFEERHVTDGGMNVRSKSEAMIGTQMEARKMMFRTEPQLLLGTQFVYPDFEVFLPNIRRRVYIEHFGKMDDPQYLMKAMHKIENYHESGLYLGVNFFFTWETMARPLTITEINKMLDRIEALDE